MSNLFPLILSFLLSLGVTPIVIWLYRRLGWLDRSTVTHHPKHIHERPTPRGGGIAIWIASLAATLIFLPLDKHLGGILAGATILMVLGSLDDRFDIHPLWRLLGGFVAAGCVIAAGIGIPFLTNPFADSLIHLNQPQLAFTLFGDLHTIWILADLFAFIWIVSVMNFVNWSKGLDGQLPGTVGIAAIVIAILSQRFSADITQWATGILALIVAGAYFGFLPWNLYPQRIMPGYGGGALAGYFLAVLSILSTTKVGTLLIVLGIPLIDAFYVLIRRLWAGQNPIWGDTRHFHHLLLKRGLSKPTIAYIYWGVTAILGVIALQLNSQQKLYTMIALIGAFGGILLWIQRFKPSSSPRDPDSG